MERYEPRKRTALDGKVWWCIYDTTTQKWSTHVLHRKYRTKKATLEAIEKTKGA